MEVKFKFNDINVKEEKEKTLVKVLMLKGDKGDKGDGDFNVIEDVKVNGTSLPVSNKAVNVPIPTNVSSFNNDSGYLIENDLQMVNTSNVVNGSQITDGTGYARLNKVLGNTSQVGTPTPDNPINIDVVTGDVTIQITDANNTSSQIFNLSLGDIELYNKDFIFEENNKWYISKKNRHLSLPIANMNNNENYPGWQNQTQLQSDFPSVNTQFVNVTAHYCNIFKDTDNALGINTNINNGVLYFRTNSVKQLTQTQWKTQYPNLVFELVYEIPTAEVSEITDTTLINQLNNIKNFVMYENETNFAITSDNLIPALNITYAITDRDIYSKEEVNDKISQINKIQKKKVYYFDTIALLKETVDLVENDMVITKGYYEANDGGAGEYEIVNDNTLVADGGFVHNLSNGLKAKLIVKNNTVNIKQLGARSQDKNNNKYDIKNFIETYLNFNENNSLKTKLYIPSGVYYTSPVDIVSDRGFYIYGDESFSFRNGTTIISSYNDNQSYIFSIGNNEKFTQNFTFKNIALTSADFTYSDTYKTCVLFDNANIKNITESLLKIKHCQFGLFDNLFFIHTKGRCFSMNSSWELYFGTLNFRNIRSINNSIMCFQTRDTSLLDASNLTALCFDKIMFEQVVGDLIECEENCYFTNSKFGLINFEDYMINYDDIEYTSNDFSELSSDYVTESIIKLDDGAKVQFTINDIQLNNFSYRYITYNNNQYCYDTIVNIKGETSDSNVTGIIINNIITTGIGKTGYFVKSTEYNSDYYSSVIINNNEVIYGTYSYLFDIKNMKEVKVNNDVFKTYDYTSGLIPNRKFAGSVHSFKDYIYHNGKMETDSDSLSEYNLVLAVNGSSVSNLICVEGSNKLYIKAKLENNVSTNFIIYSPNHYNLFPITGTGDYELYELDLTGKNYNIGEFISVHLGQGINGKFDYFYWE